MLLGMKFRLFIVFTFVLVSSLAVVGQTSDKTETELKSLVRRMVDAQAAFDVKALDAVLTPDYIEISPLGEFDTRDKVLGFYKPELKPPANQMPTNMELSDYSVRIDVRVQTGKERLEGRVRAIHRHSSETTCSAGKAELIGKQKQNSRFPVPLSCRECCPF